MDGFPSVQYMTVCAFLISSPQKLTSRRALVPLPEVLARPRSSFSGPRHGLARHDHKPCPLPPESGDGRVPGLWTPRRPVAGHPEPDLGLLRVFASHYAACCPVFSLISSYSVSHGARTTKCATRGTSHPLPKNSRYDPREGFRLADCIAGQPRFVPDVRTADDADRMGGFPCRADTLSKTLWLAADPPIDGDPTDFRSADGRAAAPALRLGQGASGLAARCCGRS